MTQNLPTSNKGSRLINLPTFSSSPTYHQLSRLLYSSIIDPFYPTKLLLNIAEASTSTYLPKPIPIHIHYHILLISQKSNRANSFVQITLLTLYTHYIHAYTTTILTTLHEKRPILLISTSQRNQREEISTWTTSSLSKITPRSAPGIHLPLFPLPSFRPNPLFDIQHPPLKPH